jgi:acetyl esterase/lipase
MDLRAFALFALGVFGSSTGVAGARAAQAEPADASVSAKVVPEDTYPAGHIDFANGVVGTPDRVYSTLPGFRPLRLDLYQPDSGRTSGPYPFVVYVHGGGWFSGHTRQSGAFASWPTVLASLAARGYVVASVEYRLSGEAPFPAAIQDVKAALRWLRAHSSEYSIDAGHGLIWGASAGGQLAALAATSCGVAELEPPLPSAPRPEPGRVETTPRSPQSPPSPVATAPGDDCVQAAITWYGIFDFGSLASQRDPAATAARAGADSPDARYLGCVLAACPQETLTAASPVSYVKRESPPMLLIHGAGDHTVPVQQSKEMFDRSRAAGAPAQLLIIPDVDHSFIGSTSEQTQKASRDALQRVFAFIDQTIGRGSKKPRGGD